MVIVMRLLLNIALNLGAAGTHIHPKTDVTYFAKMIRIQSIGDQWPAGTKIFHCVKYVGFVDAEEAACWRRRPSLLCPPDKGIGPLSRLYIE
jgi:hypothetical protein